MTITLDPGRLLFWRRIAALEGSTAQLRLGLAKALSDNEKQQKMLTALLMAEPRKREPEPKKLRSQSEVNAFLGENYDAPS